MIYSDNVINNDIVRPNLERAIGESVKNLRLSRGLTVAKLSEQANLSIGMLSKIENGITSPSLKTLLGLSQALNVPVITFFQRFDVTSELVHLRYEDMANPERGAIQNLVAQVREPHGNTASESYLVNITDPQTLPEPIRHTGIVHLHMLEGSLSYHHGETICELNMGDVLIFDARTAHGIVKIKSDSARYLAVVCSSYAGPDAGPDETQLYK